MTEKTLTNTRQQAYCEWLAAQVKEAEGDPRPDLSHEEAIADLDAVIEEIEREHAPRRDVLNKP